MSGPRIGSLCTGYGGLDDAVQQVLGGELAWVADPDPGAAAILAHHHPTVRNLGDITATDWTTVEPVDALTAGFPCQDVSVAGLRAGIAPGTRSGLWAHVARAIQALNPRIVVIENVRGLLSQPADRGMGPGGTPLAESEPGPLRALGAVLGDLADLGFDAEWLGLPASDPRIGAPHERWREFILAWPAAEDPYRPAREERRPAAPGQAQGRGARATAVPGLDREAQLRAIGNGVVPRQAVLALRLLLARAPEAAAGPPVSCPAPAA
ncbi:DNA cytosine methyltransferase [Streptomyces sp. DSM 44917]|uniref:DNA cytosine methyltransferase n=1 Tax=Streptomyces boetiae TaxID=3075541 RepID=A0ABU2L3R9_9ACTN|nr:DNA cytosine methyltransferase [Streptomyces sp. DSM 44917]MDT0306162.1 DNA cytosine methyltransferase [Streptomyces sp. DSM 44917]